MPVTQVRQPYRSGSYWTRCRTDGNALLRRVTRALDNEEPGARRRPSDGASFADMETVRPKNLLVYDVNGLIHPDREDLHPHQEVFAREHPARQLEEGLRGADVFAGASAGGVLTQQMIRSMNRFPLVFALATPEPEIDYEEARASRRDAIVATALAQHPNAIVDLLSFPYIFRGALDVGATRITEGMLVAAARALAELAREEVVEEVERAYGNRHFSFGPEYLLPKPIDPRILVRESAAVAKRAVEEGVARRPVDLEAYQVNLEARLGTGRETMRGSSFGRARRSPGSCSPRERTRPSFAQPPFSPTKESPLPFCWVPRRRSGRPSTISTSICEGCRSSSRLTHRVSTTTWSSISECDAAAASCWRPPGRGFDSVTSSPR